MIVLLLFWPPDNERRRRILPAQGTQQRTALTHTWCISNEGVLRLTKLMIWSHIICIFFFTLKEQWMRRGKKKTALECRWHVCRGRNVGQDKGVGGHGVRQPGYNCHLLQVWLLQQEQRGKGGEIIKVNWIFSCGKCSVTAARQTVLSSL